MASLDRTQAVDRHKLVYWLILLLVGALSLLYAERRNLYARYLEHEQTIGRVRGGREQCDTLKNEIESSRQRVEHLGTDPAEIEAAIRRNKDLVREGEKGYRIEKAQDGNAMATDAGAVSGVPGAADNRRTSSQN
jgi:cell division protein FtsB